LLRHLEHAGFDGAPRWLGTDELGREILSYVEGDVPHRPYPAGITDPEVLAGLARLLRASHDAAAGFTTPPGAAFDVLDAAGPDDEPELVAHADVTPENVVFRDGVPYALIDWDMARPTTRLFDVVSTLRFWGPISAPQDRDPAFAGVDVGARMRLFADVYGLGPDQRERLLDLAALRLERSYVAMQARALTRGGGWARMWAAGVGGKLRRAAGWLEEERPVLEKALR
jgi:aminoglycoside phosphotransferase (APT) family kinase protein